MLYILQLVLSDRLISKQNFPRSTKLPCSLSKKGKLFLLSHSFIIHWWREYCVSSDALSLAQHFSSNILIVPFCHPATSCLHNLPRYIAYYCLPEDWGRIFSLIFVTTWCHSTEDCSINSVGLFGFKGQRLVLYFKAFFGINTDGVKNYLL
jgi:hypothetical protein